ncbi:hypothetical protein CJ195_25365 [Bacillus sp. UMB0899]|nr:hypothetical protein CJ195_25365 [Bacillus sp. UMB0899]
MSLGLKWFVMDSLQSYIQENELVDAVNFYYERLKDTKGKVLELGHNSLYLLPIFMNRGLKMEGVIETEGGKKDCNEKCAEIDQSAKLLQAMLPNYKTASLYEAIILPFGGISAKSRRVEAIKIVKNSYDHLKDKGIFIVDLYLQREFSELQTDNIVIEKNDDLFVGETKLVKFDLIEQKATYTLSIEHWKEGQNPYKENKIQTFSWFGIKEFKLILERIGFSSVTIYTDYSNHANEVLEGKVFTFLAQK